jgi:hypothetical protein
MDIPIIEKFDLIKMDPAKTQIRFYQDYLNDMNSSYFHLQFKNELGENVDIQLEELQVFSNLGLENQYKISRTSRGVYNLTFEKLDLKKIKVIELFYQKVLLKKQKLISWVLPVKKYSSLTLISNPEGKLNFELRLADGQKYPVDLPEPPEIIIDGKAKLEILQPVKKGVWFLRVSYPEENQIIYISVRVLGVSFDNFYRYQHVEK